MCRAAATEQAPAAPAKPALVGTEDYELPDGSVVRVMADDYGHRSGGHRMYQDHYGEVPAGIFTLVRNHGDKNSHLTACNLMHITSKQTLQLLPTRTMMRSGAGVRELCARVEGHAAHVRQRQVQDRA